jgi:hypothetical protein
VLCLVWLQSITPNVELRCQRRPRLQQLLHPPFGFVKCARVAIPCPVRCNPLQLKKFDHSSAVGTIIVCNSVFIVACFPMIVMCNTRVAYNFCLTVYTLFFTLHTFVCLAAAEEGGPWLSSRHTHSMHLPQLSLID